MVAVDDDGSRFGDVVLVDDGDVAEEHVARVPREHLHCPIKERHIQLIYSGSQRSELIYCPIIFSYIAISCDPSYPRSTVTINGPPTINGPSQSPVASPFGIHKSTRSEPLKKFTLIVLLQFGLSYLDALLLLLLLLRLLSLLLLLLLIRVWFAVYPLLAVLHVLEDV